MKSNKTDGTQPHIFFLGGKIAAVLLLVGLLSTTGYGQGFESVMEQMSQDAAQAYAIPLVDAFGANLHNGWFNLAPGAKIFGVDLKLGLVLSGAFLPNEDQTFAVTGVYRFQKDEAVQLAQSINGYNSLEPSLQQEIVETILKTDFTASISGPTIFGSETDNVVVSTAPQTIQVSNQTFTVPGDDITLEDVTGLIEDPGIVPHLSPQITLGTVYGTQATIRWLPAITISDQIGSLKLFGFGVQHNPGVWFSNPLPLNISLGYLHQNLKIGSIVDANTNAFSINVSKTFGALLISATPYAGFMFEKTEIDFSFLYDQGGGLAPVDVAFTVEGVNKRRLILGLGVSVLGLNLNADYEISTINTVSLGIVYGF